MKNQIQTKFDKLAAEYSDKYDNATDIFGCEKRRRKELLLDCADEINPRSTLDAGCGSGVVLSALQSRLPGAQLAGVDLSHLMLKQAHANTLTDVALVQCFVEQLPFADKSFDLIYALGILDYLEHPSQFFKTVWRVLKPGGCFIFTYPSGDSINRALRTRLRIYFRSRKAISAAMLTLHTLMVLCPWSRRSTMMHKGIKILNTISSVRRELYLPSHRLESGVY